MESTTEHEETNSSKNVSNQAQMEKELKQSQENNEKLEKSILRHSAEIREFRIKNTEMEKTIDSLVSTHKLQLKYLRHCQELYPFLVSKKNMNQVLIQMLKDCFIFSSKPCL
jgi:hypothetical protein